MAYEFRQVIHFINLNLYTCVFGNAAAVKVEDPIIAGKGSKEGTSIFSAFY